MNLNTLKSVWGKIAAAAKRADDKVAAVEARIEKAMNAPLFPSDDIRIYTVMAGGVPSIGFDHRGYHVATLTADQMSLRLDEVRGQHAAQEKDSPAAKETARWIDAYEKGLRLMERFPHADYAAQEEAFRNHTTPPKFLQKADARVRKKLG